MKGYMMGCDFEFFGAIPSTDVRTMCLEFLASVLGQQPQVITVDKGKVRRFDMLVFASPEAKRHVTRAGYTRPRSVPGNCETFVGFRESLWDLQLVFDVSHGGNLCMLVPPEEITRAFTPKDPEERWMWAPNEVPWGRSFPRGTAVAILGGRIRMDSSDPFLPALLVALKCRFMPELIVSDDYFVFAKAYAEAKRRRLCERFAQSRPLVLAQRIQDFMETLW